VRRLVSADHPLAALPPYERKRSMPTRISRCTVVEIPESSPGVPDLALGAKDVLPWADPYITALLTSRRLQAALDDSLRFIESEQEGDWPGHTVQGGRG
jgi:hypothetical protein